MSHNNQHNIFHTPIWGFMLNTEQYHIEDYIETIRDMMQQTPSVKKSNFGGWQSNDNLHKIGVFRELCSTIERGANSVLESKNVKPDKITSMWANVNHKYSSNAAHVHEGILSGVFYLKVPKNSGKLVFINPAIRSDARMLRESNYGVTPEPLAMILFPSWLEHYVEQNLSDEDRISISFNIG